MVRSSEWPSGHKTRFAIEYASNGVDLCGLQSFFETQRRKDARDALRQHRFARSWRTDHQDVMPSRTRYFEGSLCRELSSHITEVGLEALHLREHVPWIDRQRSDAVACVDQLDHVGQALDRIHV